MKTKVCIFIFFIYNISIPVLGRVSKNKEFELRAEKSNFFSAIQNFDFTEILNTFKKNQEAFSWYKRELVALIEKEGSQDFGDELLDHINTNYKNKDDLSGNTLEILGISMQKKLRSFLKKKLHDQEEIQEIIKNLDIVHRFHLKLAVYETIAFCTYPVLEVRKSSFQALSIMDTDRVFPTIMKLVNSERVIERVYALDGFYYINDERTIPLMIQALKDPNKSVRYYAIKTLDRLKRLEAIPFFLRIIRSDVNKEVRKKAIVSLKKFRPASGFYPLLATLSDPDQEIRKTSLDAISAYKNKKACYYISAQLARESEDHLKMKQIKVLLSMNSSGGANGLVKIIKNEQDIEILRWAIFTAGKLKDIYSFQAILDKLKHGSSGIRSEAANALAQYKSASASNALLEVLSNKGEEYFVQATALFALKAIRSNAILPELFELSENHDNDYIRVQIRQVISELIKNR